MLNSKLSLFNSRLQDVFTSTKKDNLIIKIFKKIKNNESKIKLYCLKL